jgi:Protein of unknown function (DUF805)
VLLPSLAVGARRLHDTGRSGWWLLIGIIPLIGWIVIIVFLVTEGERQPNAYGSDPKAVPGEAAASPNEDGLRLAHRVPAGIQWRPSVLTPRPVQRRNDSLYPSWPRFQQGRHRPARSQLLCGQAFRVDQLFVGDGDTFRYRRRHRAPRTASL